MHDQQSLFDIKAQQQARARKSDPETSHEAAGLVDAAGLMNMIEAELRQYPAGLTTQELADYLDRKLVSISPRMKPMEQAGRVKRAGKRKTPGNAQATIWKSV